MRRKAAITDAELNRVLRVARKHGKQSVYAITKPIKVAGRCSVKIGISRNPLRRLSQLQTGNDADLKLRWVHVQEMLEAAEIEKGFHSLLAHANLSGEWFDAPLQCIPSFFELAIERGFDDEFIKLASGVFGEDKTEGAILRQIIDANPDLAKIAIPASFAFLSAWD